MLLNLVVEPVAIVDQLDNDDVFQIVVEMKTVVLERGGEDGGGGGFIKMQSLLSLFAHGGSYAAIVGNN